MLNKEKLIGKWKSKTETAFGNIEMFFDCDGLLDYSILQKDKKEIMKLTYEVDGDYIISNQPSKSREEKTLAKIEGDILTLNFNGAIGEFVRVV